eukprot:4782566-Alexandrium_andersonii.AAC.1
MHVHHPRMDPEGVAERKCQAKVRLQLTTDIYRAQLERGAHFLHEHPMTAGSWNEGCVQHLLGHPE